MSAMNEARLEYAPATVGHSQGFKAGWLAAMELAKRERDEELAQLREVVRKLPRTADGVIMVPGMKLYPMHPLPEEDLDGADDCFEVVMSGYDSETCDDIEPYELPLNYSSKEAAALARASETAGGKRWAE